jgi:hypothetical protein
MKFVAFPTDFLISMHFRHEYHDLLAVIFNGEIIIITIIIIIIIIIIIMEFSFSGSQFNCTINTKKTKNKFKRGIT